jgi:D-arabinose 1-dehydrogenase-like Zn-dependent alcohol dehydrogenase
MKAARLVEYNQPLKVEEVPEPQITGPYDVIVRIGGAGVCRTDLHLMEAVWKDTLNSRLPFTIGHENAGWIEEVGQAVTNVQRGDAVICHPVMSCGFCRACRAGNDMHCVNVVFPGLTTDGGYAQYLKTSARSVIKLKGNAQPAEVAPFADAGITAYHAIKKTIPLSFPGSSTVITGIGGLGHIGLQLVHAMTTARAIALDTSDERLQFARSMGADETVNVTRGNPIQAVQELTEGGADIVVDFVGTDQTLRDSFAMLRKGGTYLIVGYGGVMHEPSLDMVNREITVLGNLVGTYNDLAELMELYYQGRVKIHAVQFPFAEVNDVLHKLDEGHIEGRAVLVP